jgi:predicted Fe-Mo cluster-binding NifX family protein
MSCRVAVASSDGKVINQHFGRAGQFLVFDLEEKGPEFYELRKTVPLCGSEANHDNLLQHTVQSLSDCRVILVSRVGPGAEEALTQAGIQVLAIPGLIEPVLRKLHHYLRNQDKENQR